MQKTNSASRSTRSVATFRRGVFPPPGTSFSRFTRAGANAVRFGLRRRRLNGNPSDRCSRKATRVGAILSVCAARGNTVDAPISRVIRSARNATPQPLSPSTPDSVTGVSPR